MRGRKCRSAGIAALAVMNGWHGITTAVEDREASVQWSSGWCMQWKVFGCDSVGVSLCRQDQADAVILLAEIKNDTCTRL